jgi:transposase
MVAAARSEGSVVESILYVAFELGKKEWHLALTSGVGVAAWVRTVPGGDLRAVERVIAQARQRFGLGAEAGVVSCYEAGRDGFWIHRALAARGIRNRVVDSASIEVNRRARRMKTDRIDALKLVTMLMRVCGGEPRVWHEVRVPSEGVEAARHVSRERSALVRERTRWRNQITSWLATYGCSVSTQARQRRAWWTRVLDWQGRALPPTVQARIERAQTRLAVVGEQIMALEAQQREARQSADPESALTRLTALKGVATTGASVLLAEGLVWRDFRNRRQIGGVLGFAPMKYQSGTLDRDRGISRAGNPRWQAVSVQLAWSWLHWQPQSALAQWYHAHFGGRRRDRKIGIVALARKLVIALWRYATQGVVPAGAILKSAARG